MRARYSCICAVLEVRGLRGEGGHTGDALIHGQSMIGRKDEMQK
jgi:hypothetical protein